MVGLGTISITRYTVEVMARGCLTMGCLDQTVIGSYTEIEDAKWMKRYQEIIKHRHVHMVKVVNTPMAIGSAK